MIQDLIDYNIEKNNNQQKNMTNWLLFSLKEIYLSSHSMRKEEIETWRFV